MGFFTSSIHTSEVEFGTTCRNPFQGGMGFFTGNLFGRGSGRYSGSQSLSGWDGVFHNNTPGTVGDRVILSVAIPFRVGWGFSPHKGGENGWREKGFGRNPFQGGMGFFTARPNFLPLCHYFRRNPFQGGMGFFTSMAEEVRVLWVAPRSQSLSGWDGVFHLREKLLEEVANVVAIPFRVGWGFSLANV